MSNEDFLKALNQDDGEKLLINAFNTYYDKIFNFFSYHIYNYEQAQDMTGEVFLKAACAWNRYDSSKGAVSTWIFTIARNILHDYWRKKRYIQVELGEMPDDTDLSEHIEMEEDKRMLMKALSILSDREREIISLKYMSELKNTEIAAITGLTGANVGIVLFRAVGKLRKEMEIYDGGQKRR